MKFDIIYADPPWNFRVWGNPMDSKRTAASHYPIMQLEDIKNLPVKDIAEKNCALFLWATYPNLKEALEVIEAWGFVYKTLAWEWIKLTKTGKKMFVGLGYYTRANPEPCLLAVRGKMPVATHAERNILPAFELDENGLPLDDYYFTDDQIISLIREHSRKPEEAYEKINRLYPNEKYYKRVELFASRFSEEPALKNNFTPIGYDIDRINITTRLAQLRSLDL